MIIHATLVRAALEAAIANCGVGPPRRGFPDELYTNAGKYHGAANYGPMVRHLHDIAGGSVLTAPSPAAFENRTARSSASTWGRWRRRRRRVSYASLPRDSRPHRRCLRRLEAVTNMQAGGGLFAQRIVTRRYYDMDGAKRKALSLAGLDEVDTR